MSIYTPFQLLELNIISAQDLPSVSRKMKTYAVVWIHSEHKLTTRVDYTGGSNPTWNDKFVFRVNEEFLYADTSAVMVEIYALHWFRDVHVGTVRVLISNLIPPSHRPGYRNNGNNEKRRSSSPPKGMRFVALQVRRASGQPQGILNIGVGLLDGSMRSMPLYTHMNSSAVGYQDLLGEEDRHLQHLNLNSHKGSSRNPVSPESKQYHSVVSKPEFRRTKSDSSSMVVSDLLNRAERSRAAYKQPASTLVSSESETTPGHDPTSSDSESKKIIVYPPPNRTSDIRRFDLIESDDIDPPRREKPNVPPSGPYDSSQKTPKRTPMNNEPRPPKDSSRRGGSSPYLSRHGTPLRSNIVGSTPIHPNGAIGSTPMRSNAFASTPFRSNAAFGSTPLRSNAFASTPKRSNAFASTPMRSHIIESTPMRSNYMATPMKSHLEFNTPMRSNKPAGRPFMTNSELGPSPSELADQIAKERSQPDDNESSIISEWSIDDSSAEGLRTKLERWRTELPPVYDIGSSHLSSDLGGAKNLAAGGGRSSRRKTPAAVKKHNRRHTDGGNGLFSCFSNICGMECSFVCGGSDPDGSKTMNKRKGGSGRRVYRTASADNLSHV